MKLIVAALSIFAAVSVITAESSYAVEFHSRDFRAQSLRFAGLAPVSWDGIVSMDGCSGAVVSLGGDDSTKAALLTNGHCFDESMAAGSYAVDQSSSGSVEIFSSTGQQVRHNIDRLIYATMTKTDASLFELDVTYQQLLIEGVHPFTLSAASAKAGDEITMISGYHEKEQSCSISALVYELREAQIDTFNAYRYDECKSVPGWSGSPLIARGTRVIVGVNNTHYSGRTACTDDNPCEVDQAGKISVGPTGTSYGQQTALIHSCVGSDGKFDVKLAGCQLRF